MVFRQRVHLVRELAQLQTPTHRVATPQVEARCEHTVRIMQSGSFLQSPTVILLCRCSDLLCRLLRPERAFDQSLRQPPLAHRRPPLWIGRPKHLQPARFCVVALKDHIKPWRLSGACTTRRGRTGSSHLTA